MVDDESLWDNSGFEHPLTPESNVGVGGLLWKLG